jgi:hypothetical protein
VWSPSFCSFLQHPATSSPLCPNILLSTLFSNTCILCPLMWETMFHTHTKQWVKL